MAYNIKYPRRKSRQTDMAMYDFVKVVTQPYIKGVLQGSVLNGHSAEALLVKAGLPADLLNKPNASINGEAFQRLLLTIEAETGDYFLGFLNEPAKLAMIGQQLKLRHQCETFGEFIRVGTEFREAVRNDVHYECLNDNENHEFTMVVEYKLREGIDEHIFYWHRLTLIYRYWSWIIGKRIKLNRVHFSSPKPDFCMDCQALFNCEVLFDQARNSISFDMRYLQNPITRSESESREFITKNPDWLTTPGQDRSWSRQVEDVLIRLQQENILSPSIAQTAEMLSMSARTLRRRLARENETFQRVRGRVRSEQAKKLLVTTDTPVTIIANQVGYTEPGVFTRAFIGWTSMTPSDYRAAHRKRHTGARY